MDVSPAAPVLTRDEILINARPLRHGRPLNDTAAP